VVDRERVIDVPAAYVEIAHTYRQLNGDGEVLALGCPIKRFM
jgi:hypothetical protein